MRPAALALALLATPAAAAPHGPGCQLSTAECAVVVREIAADDLLAIDDERAMGGSDDLQVRRILIDRHYARIKARIDRLPPRIGAEFARIRACQAGDHLAMLQGTENANPQCR